MERRLGQLEEKLANRVFTLVDEDEGFPQHREASALLYDFYRWLSTWESHGTLGALVGHGELVDGLGRVRRVRQVSSERTELLIRIGALFIGMLAMRSELPVGPMEDRMDRILEGTSIRALWIELLSQEGPWRSAPVE